VGIQQSLQGRACLGIVATRFGQESRPLVGGPLQCVVNRSFTRCQRSGLMGGTIG